MKILKPIAINTQITDAIFGPSKETRAAIEEKIEFLKNNIDRIDKINGSKIYHPMIKGKNIYYNLRDYSKKLEEFGVPSSDNWRKYYYPIQYATITLQ